MLAQLKALKPADEGRAKGKGKGKGIGKGKKCFEGYGETHNWTHITPFMQLPYFKDLKLPYNIDVMHTERMWQSPFSTRSSTFLIRRRITLKLEPINREFEIDHA